MCVSANNIWLTFLRPRNYTIIVLISTHWPQRIITVSVQNHWVETSMQGPVISVSVHVLFSDPFSQTYLKLYKFPKTIHTVNLEFFLGQLKVLSCLLHPSINFTLISCSVWEIKNADAIFFKNHCLPTFRKWFSFSQFMRDKLKRTENYYDIII